MVDYLVQNPKPTHWYYSSGYKAEMVQALDLLSKRNDPLPIPKAFDLAESNLFRGWWSDEIVEDDREKGHWLFYRTTVNRLLLTKLTPEQIAQSRQMVLEHPGDDRYFRAANFLYENGFLTTEETRTFFEPLYFSTRDKSAFECAYEILTTQDPSRAFELFSSYIDIKTKNDRGLFFIDANIMARPFLKTEPRDTVAFWDSVKSKPSFQHHAKVFYLPILRRRFPEL